MISVDRARQIVSLLAVLAIVFPNGSNADQSRITGKSRNASNTVLRLKSPPAAFLERSVVTDLQNGCLTPAVSSLLAQQLGLQETAFTQQLVEPLSATVEYGSTSCLRYAAAVEMSGRHTAVAVMGARQGLDKPEVLFLARDFGGDALVTRKFHVDTAEDQWRAIDVNVRDFGVAPGSSLTEIPLHLRWELSLLIQQMKDSFGEFTDASHVRVVLRRKVPTAMEGISAVELIETSSNQLIDSALWLDRADGPGSFFSKRGVDYERILWQSPIKYVRISRGVGESTTTLRRRIAVKARPNQKAHIALRTLTIKAHHVGIDLVAPRGTVVHAVADGEVVFSAAMGGFGKLVILDHGKGHQTYYAHLAAFAPGVEVKKFVHRGEEIGYVGSTGLSTGPHLHFELRKDGQYIDPFALQNKLAFWSLQPEDHQSILAQMLVLDLTRSTTDSRKFAVTASSGGDAVNIAPR